METKIDIQDKEEKWNVVFDDNDELDTKSAVSIDTQATKLEDILEQPKLERQQSHKSFGIEKEPYDVRISPTVANDARKLVGLKIVKPQSIIYTTEKPGKILEQPNILQPDILTVAHPGGRILRNPPEKANLPRPYIGQVKHREVPIANRPKSRAQIIREEYEDARRKRDQLALEERIRLEKEMEDKRIYISEVKKGDIVMIYGIEEKGKLVSVTMSEEHAINILKGKAYDFALHYHYEKLKVSEEDILEMSKSEIREKYNITDELLNAKIDEIVNAKNTLRIVYLTSYKSDDKFPDGFSKND